jgi:hypothetical protein
MRVLLSILSAIALNTCDGKKEEAIQASPASISTVAIPDTIHIGQPVAFEITCSTPNPCWAFQRFDIVQSGFVYTIKVIAEYDGRPCIQILGSFTTPSSIIPKERGAYTLRFWRAEDRFLEKTVVVR